MEGAIVLAGTILGNITRIDRCFTNYKRNNLKELNDIYPALHAFIHYICGHPGCLQEELIEELYVDKTTVTHHLGRLEEKGYIERRVDENDARRRKVYPTQKALEAAPKLHQVYHDFLGALMDGLTEQEQDTVKALTDKLFENAAKLVRS